MMFTNPQTTIHLIERLAAISVCIASLELLVQSRHLRDDGLMGWPISRLRHRFLTQGFAAPFLDALFAYPTILGLITLRLFAGVALLCLPNNTWQLYLTATIALLSLALTLRSPFGLDGADQMSVFLFSTLTLTYLCPHPAVQTAFLWFLALQSCLSYITAGAAKAVSSEWRTGSALIGISRTKMYGSVPVATYLQKHSGQCVWLCRTVIVTECLFPLALIVPPPVSMVILAAGVAFHATSAVVMGLNTFFWSFLATYPAILYCSGQIYGG